ncbi:MAG: PAS domain S-box protein [Kofleriaceae bacterium]
MPDLLACIAGMAEELSTGGRPTLPSDVAELHAVERLREGFDLGQVVTEFALLRDAILRLWERDQFPPSQVSNLRLLNHAIDRAISESVERYTKARDRTLQSLDRISNAALESTCLDDFLGRLLGVLVETTPAVDTAAILLREADRLRVRASVGLEQDVATGFTLKIGEGFAGAVAAERCPKLLLAASTDPMVKMPSLRHKRVRALYGVPIIDDDQVIGVAHIGSLGAHQFSDQDKRLLIAMAHRAATAISQHLLRERDAERTVAENKARAEAERGLAVVDALLSSSLVGFGFIDTDLRYVRVNEALAVINGPSPAEHTGRTMREILGHHADVLEPIVRTVIETGEAVTDLELNAAPPSTPDHVRSFLASYFPVRTPSRETIGVGVAVVEITERKRMEARLQKALSIQTVGVVFYDLHGRVLDANPALERMSGYTRDQLRQVSWQQLTPPEFGDVTARAAEQIEATGETAPYEKQWIRPDGSRWWGLFAPTRISGSGRDSECVEFIIDVTARNQAEEAVREREVLFRTLADSISQFAWMADETGSIVWFNQRWFEYTGTTLDEVKGWGWQKIQHPDHVQRVIAKLRDHFETGETWEDTFPLRGKDGRYRWFLSRALPIRNDHGTVVRWFGTNTDVTDTRLLGEVTTALSSSLDYRETLQRMAELLVPALADWCTVDLLEREGHIQRIVSVHSDPANTALASELARSHPPDPSASSGSARVMRTGVPDLVPEVSDEFLATVARSPERLQMLRDLGIKSCVLVPLIARDRTLGAIGIVSAESGRRYAQRDLELLEEVARRAAIAIDNARLYEEVQRAVRMREELLAVVSHDLKNPLGAIQLAGAMLLGRPAEDPRRRQQIEVINRSASRMDHLIGDLLDMASIQAGRLAIERRLDEPGAVLTEAVEMHRPAAREKGVTISCVCPLRELRILLDRDRILQVLGNLLGNAIKFCRSGDEITVRCQRSVHEAVFAISDSGPGIPESDLPHVFEPYWSARGHAKKGTGLGLYISKGVIEAHGGRLWVESAPGEGATFYFTLPIAEM